MVYCQLVLQCLFEIYERRQQYGALQYKRYVTSVSQVHFSAYIKGCRLVHPFGGEGIGHRGTQYAKDCRGHCQVNAIKVPLVIIADTMRSFAGVVLVSLADSSYPRTDKPADLRPLSPNPLLGDSFALASALFYALYVSLLKVRMREESRVNMQLFFGFVGLFNVITLWPLGLVVHFLGVEPFELPQNWKEWSGIGINVSL